MREITTCTFYLSFFMRMVNVISLYGPKMAAVASAGTLEELEEKRGKALRRDFVVWNFDKCPKDNKFLAFRAPKDFYQFLQSLNPSKRTFCETILEGRQKPRFDLDFQKKELPIMRRPEDIVNELIYAIVDTFEQVELKDILIYSSNSEQMKIHSYHVVIDNWYHKSSREAKRAYKSVVKAMPPDLAVFLDHSVYKPLQQFRMLYNSKPNELRFKIREKEWKYLGKVIDSAYSEGDAEDDFYSSLLTVTEGCKHLPVHLGEEGSFSAWLTKGERESEEADIDQLRTLVPEGYALDPKKKPYGYRLKRIKRSYCLVCNRMHGTDSKGDNARIFIRNNKIYLSCFRDEEKRHYLLDTVDDEQPTVQEEATKLEEESLCSPTMVAVCDPKQYLSSSLTIKFDYIYSILEQQRNQSTAQPH